MRTDRWHGMPSCEAGALERLSSTLQQGQQTLVGVKKVAGGENASFNSKSDSGFNSNLKPVVLTTANLATPVSLIPDHLHRKPYVICISTHVVPKCWALRFSILQSLYPSCFLILQSMALSDFSDFAVLHL